MRGNGRKTKNKRYKLLCGALHRGVAVALGVFLLAGQLELATYAVEDSVVLEEGDTENSQAVTHPEDGGEGNGEGEDTSSENAEEKQPEAGGEPPMNEGDEMSGKEEEQNPGEGEPEAEMPVPEDTADEDFKEENAGNENIEEAEEELIEEERGETAQDRGAEVRNTLDYDFIVFGDVQLSFNRIAEDEVEVAGYASNGGKWTVPASIEHDGKVYRVTKIGDKAFYNCSYLTDIELADSVTVIGDFAFSGSNISEIMLPQHLTDIGERAFSKCENLTEIVIPDSIEKIGTCGFSECKKLTNVSMPDKYIEFGAGVFLGCSSLPDIVIPSQITRIPESMFRACNGLTKVTIPDHITVIGAKAFQNCEELETVIIPSSVQEIEEYAFSVCYKLTDISIADGVKVLGSSVFSACPALQEIEIPDSVTEIGTYGFSACTGLKRIKLSANLTNISSYMFNICVNLVDVTIPQSVTYIGENAFTRCRNLSDITIPSAVTYLDNWSFYECDSLTEIKIAVEVLEENGQKKVNPLEAGTNAFGSMEPGKKYYLVLLAADGKRRLVGDDFVVARDAYLNAEDGNKTNERWYGWWIQDVLTHIITASAAAGGTIDPNGDVEVAEGEDQIFTITPDEGYQISFVKADDRNVTWEEAVQALADGDQIQTGKAGTYTFSNVQANHTIEVSFEVASGTTPGEENPPKGDNDPENPGNDRPSGGTTGTSNTDNTSAPAAEMSETVVDGSVQAAPAVVTETADLTAQNGRNQTTADNAASPKDAQSKEPKTGDSAQMEIYATLAMIAGLTYMLLYLMEEGRSMTEREKDVFVAAFIRWAKKGGSFRKCCALVAIFCILAYYHSVGKRTEGQVCPAQN